MDNNSNDKWLPPETYDWGEIYRLKDQYRARCCGCDGLEYIHDDYWFIGDSRFDERGMENIDELRKIQNKNFGIKYWEFRKADTEKQHKPKQVETYEYNFVLEGKILGSVGPTKDIILRAGDFILIKPASYVNVNLQEEILQDAKGITIKIPLKIENKNN